MRQAFNPSLLRSILMIQPNKALMGVFYCDPEDVRDPSNWFAKDEVKTTTGLVKLFVTVQYEEDID
jgi:hypothetical protein